MYGNDVYKSNKKHIFKDKIIKKKEFKAYTFDDVYTKIKYMKETSKHKTHHSMSSQIWDLVVVL